MVLAHQTVDHTPWHILVPLLDAEQPKEILEVKVRQDLDLQVVCALFESEMEPI